MSQYAICNELYEGWEFPAICQHALKLGYTGLEIAPFTLGPNPTLLSPEALTKIKESIQQSGMDIVGLHWLLAKTEGFCLTSSDNQTQQDTASYLGDLAGLCADLGGNLMVLGSPQQRNFPDWRVMRMSEAPKSFESRIIESDAPPGGIGEPPTPPAAPALTNAIFDATGVRIRRLPILGDRQTLDLSPARDA